MPKPESQVQTALRVPPAFLRRLDEVASRMSGPGFNVTRTEVLRMASFRGLELLEAEWKTSKKVRR